MRVARFGQASKQHVEEDVGFVDSSFHIKCFFSVRSNSQFFSIWFTCCVSLSADGLSLYSTARGMWIRGLS
jgi:hypothetical protein